MDIGSEDLESIKEHKKIYVYCRNNSRWVPKIYLKNASACENSVKGVIEYKFVGKCHLPPNRLRFIEFFRNQDFQKALKTSKKSRTERNCKILLANIAKSKNNENEKDKESFNRIEEKSKPALINILSDDCLFEIFLYLPMEKRLEMERVCVRWRNVSKRAWNDIRELVFQSIHDPPRHNPRLFEELLVRCGVYLNSLKVDSIKLSSRMLLNIRKYCRNLTTIELNFTICEVKYFNAFSKMEKLQSFASEQVNSKYLEDILMNLPRTVKSIRIDLPHFFSIKNLPASLTNIFKEFNTLDSLTIGNYNLREDLIQVISKKETITKLDLGPCTIEKDLNLLTNLSNLEHLELQDVLAVDNNFVVCLSMKCKKLKYLNVSGCRKLSDKGVRELKNLNNLEILLISDMSNSVSDFLFGQLKGIKVLQCQNCQEVRDPGIMQLIKNSPDLKFLNVEGTSISKETLRLAMNVTKDRENSIILHLYASLHPNFIVKNGNYSPFLKYNEYNSYSEDNSSDDEFVNYSSYDSSDE